MDDQVCDLSWMGPNCSFGTASCADGLRATESGVDRRILSVVTAILALVSIASRLVFVIFNFRGTGVACIVFATGQPTVLAHTKVGR